MQKKTLISFILLLQITLVVAQKSRIYFNHSWEPCSDIEAIYFSDLEKKDSVWYRADYSVRTIQLLKHGFYKDDHFQIKHGRFEYFFGNGSISETEQFNDNKKTGLRLSLYPNGFLIDSFYFKNNIPYGICSSWYPNGQPKTEMQMDTAGNGSGLVIGFFEDGTISFKGKLAPGLRKTGNWFYYHPNGKRASVLQYAQPDSSFQNREPQIKFDVYESAYYDSTVNYSNAICYDTNGVQQPGCKIENSKPEYGKGIDGWVNYISNALSGIVQQHGNLSKPVTYIASFKVNINGETSDIMLDNSVNAKFDADILQLFKKSRKWKPAQHNNRTISFLHKQSLTLGVDF
jgi:antitoxin component YwqK of YwqJK toxin-antitoxin module